MFNLFGPKKKPQPQIRDTLFGDMPIELWAASVSVQEPWASFYRARIAIEAGAKDEAEAIFSAIIKMEGLESRQYLQAWHFLRQFGRLTPAEIKHDVLGVIVEVGMRQGLDIVAGYTDCSARYYNYSGAGVVWEHPDSTIDPIILDLLEAGRRVVEKIGLWEDVRPAAPSNGQARINMLTPAGLWFGQAPLNVLAHDQLGGPVVKVAMDLMNALIVKSKGASGA